MYYPAIVSPNIREKNKILSLVIIVFLKPALFSFVFLKETGISVLHICLIYILDRGSVPTAEDRQVLMLMINN